MEKITSRGNSVCNHIRKLGKDRKYREDNREFLCDGLKLLNEAVKSKVDIITVLTAEKLPFDIPANTRVYCADEDIIDSLSPLKNSQGLLFTCRINEPYDSDYRHGNHILLDNIQDPGNVGTIIRSAHAFGIESVILTESSADIYNPKSVRATMGAIFRQRFVRKTLNEINSIKQNGVKFIGTSNDNSSTDIEQADLRDSVLILGNEGKGISDELMALCDKMIKIPLSPDCESLNVAIAASIVMWEISRRE